MNQIISKNSLVKKNVTFFNFFQKQVNVRQKWGVFTVETMTERKKKSESPGPAGRCFAVIAFITNKPYRSAGFFIAESHF